MDNGVASIFPSQPAAIPYLAVLVIAAVRRHSGARGASLSLSKNLGALELDDGRRQLSGRSCGLLCRRSSNARTVRDSQSIHLPLHGEP